MSAPYRRGYKHTGPRGHEKYITCGFCGKNAPRYKTFVVFKGFRITDPVIKREMADTPRLSLQKKVYACPSCARHRGIVQIGKSRKSRVRNPASTTPFLQGQKFSNFRRQQS